MRRLRRAAAQRHAARADPRARPARAGALRRPGLRLRRGRPGAANGAARARRPGAGHLLRDAGDGARARRARRGRRGGRVRPDDALALRLGRAAARRPPGRAAGVDEPSRLRPRGAGRLRAARRQPRLAGGGVRVRRAQALRDPVPPGGRPHPVRHPDPRALPARDHGVQSGLVAVVGDRRAGRADPRAGRRRRASSAASPAASTPPPRPRSSTGPSATSSPAFWSTTD